MSGEILQISENGMDVSTYNKWYNYYRNVLNSTFNYTSIFSHQVMILKPLKSSHSLHKPSEEHEGFYLHSTHTYHDLPARYWKKYKYASHFVTLVRSKTPKVTVYSDLAKCMMMENSPTPDFEASFYSGQSLYCVC